MLDQSMKDQNHQSTIELKRTLLELEQRTDTRSKEESHSWHSSSVTKESESLWNDSKSDCFSATEKEYLDKAIMQNTKQYDKQFTIMLIGSQEVGKTSLMNSWLGLSNKGASQHTIG